LRSPFLSWFSACSESPRPRTRRVHVRKPLCPSIGNGRWLNLSERIFDPSDARWLAEELAFPKLAKALMLGRKRLAIRWLEALQSSFDDLVRTPESAPSQTPQHTSAGSWKMLWLTLRFKLLISYALLVVKLFGPYHRLIPSFHGFHYHWGASAGFGERRWPIAVVPTEPCPQFTCLGKRSF